MRDSLRKKRSFPELWPRQVDKALAALDAIEAKLRLLAFAEPKEYANAKRAEARIRAVEAYIGRCEAAENFPSTSTLRRVLDGRTTTGKGS